MTVKTQKYRENVIINSQVEGFVVLWRPCTGLGFSSLFSLLISQVRTDQVGFDEWTEHTYEKQTLHIVYISQSVWNDSFKSVGLNKILISYHLTLATLSH